MVDVPVLKRSSLQRAGGHYLGDGDPDPCDPRPPARAEDLSGLPSTQAMVAGVDPLRDDGRACAARLSAAGFSTEVVQPPGAAHGSDLVLSGAEINERGLAMQVRVLRDTVRPRAS